MNCVVCEKPMPLSRQTDKCELCVHWKWRNPDLDYAERKRRLAAKSGMYTPPPAPVDPSWRKQAACTDAPPELFDWRIFPNRIIPRELEDVARLWCGRCPVLNECRADAEANPTHSLGLFGGVWRSIFGEPRDLLASETEIAGAA